MTQKPTQEPSVARMVHYVAYGTPKGEYKPEHRAAVITQVNNAETGDVGLCILNPTGQFFNASVKYDEVEKAPGTWHYPERV